MSSLKRKRKGFKVVDNEGIKKNDDKKHINESDVVSKYFSNNCIELVSNSSEIYLQLLNVTHVLNCGLKDLVFSNPVKYIYNPTVYAFDSYKKYVQKYGNAEKTILFLGMNPGPFGMSQTGIPFGEINAVKNWFKIEGKIGKPEIESPYRPVQGFDCQRSEVSGKRFWDLAKTLCDTPEAFFRNCFVYNYCPLQFIGNNNGANVTPTDLKIQERDNLYQICDSSLLETLRIINCKIAVGIGLFAEKRLQKVLKDNNSIEIYSIPHPSPRAANNTDWQNKATKCLESLNLLQYFTK